MGKKLGCVMHHCMGKNVRQGVKWKKSAILNLGRMKNRIWEPDAEHHVIRNVLFYTRSGLV